MRASASLTAIALVFGATSAMAQTTTAPETRPMAPSMAPATPAPAAKPVEGQIPAQDMNTVLATDLLKATVYSPDNTKIGSVSDIILKRDGSGVDGVVVGVGGFLGLGEKWVAVKLDKIRMSDDNGSLKFVLSATKDDLNAAPAFKTKHDLASEAQRASSPAPTPAPSR
jgi:sporulation protein YlmC with PRC-barrel domain